MRSEISRRSLILFHRICKLFRSLFLMFHKPALFQKPETFHHDPFGKLRMKCQNRHCNTTAYI